VSAPYTVSSVLDHERIVHGFYGRQGGRSQGELAGNNMSISVGDNPDLVVSNRSSAAYAMGEHGIKDLVVFRQIHSTTVVTLTERPQGVIEADAMVTNRPDLLLGILTADCAPVLLVDETRQVIGAAHAGWKGAFTGVLENTVAAMEGLGARRGRIVAVLGPSIGPDNYEVGPEFVARFVEADAGNERYFRPSKTVGHSMFDLNQYTVDRLRKAGMTAESLGRCTYAEEDLFYSYRRTTHRKEADYGRQVSAIVLEKE